MLVCDISLPVLLMIFFVSRLLVSLSSGYPLTSFLLLVLFYLQALFVRLVWVCWKSEVYFLFGFGEMMNYILSMRFLIKGDFSVFYVLSFVLESIWLYFYGEKNWRHCYFSSFFLYLFFMLRSNWLLFSSSIIYIIIYIFVEGNSITFGWTVSFSSHR